MKNIEITELTPITIVQLLDKYIIGQNSAKRNVAIALRNRWRRMQAPKEIKQDIVQNNILMIGNTGVGKTEIARRLAKITNAPFVKVEASKFTEVGYVGRDVESMVRDLVDHAVNQVKGQKQREVEKKATAIVEDNLLDLLIPPVNSSQKNSQDVSDSSSDDNTMLNAKTRDKFRNKLKEGSLEDKVVEISIDKKSGAGIGMIGGQGIDESSMLGIQDMISNMMPKSTVKRKLAIKDARKVMLEEEINKLIDMDAVKDEALFVAENLGIIFIDEIDKVAKSSHKGGGEVSREGVQRDLLPIVEGSTVNTKYGTIKTDHILFIGAGAFHVAKPSDLIPEIQGRFPIRVELESLTKQDFQRILKEPKNSLTKQYEALLKAENVTITFNDDALDNIAEIAFNINSEVENIGARRLQTVMSYLLNDILFDVPDKIGANANIIITKKLVEEKLSELIENKDYNKYIV